MALDIFDPSIPLGKTPFSYAPRPKTLKNLKVGLVDNSKHNSKALLLRIADRLKERYGMDVGHLVTKLSPGHAVSEADIEAFKKTVNVGVAGIGD
jgi:hypothetical protein